MPSLAPRWGKVKLTKGSPQECDERSWLSGLVGNPHVDKADKAHGRSRKSQIWVQEFQWHFGMLNELHAPRVEWFESDTCSVMTSWNINVEYKWTSRMDIDLWWFVIMCGVVILPGSSTQDHLEGISWVAPAAQNTLSTSFYLYIYIHWFDTCIKLIHALLFCLRANSLFA